MSRVDLKIIRAEESMIPEMAALNAAEYGTSPLEVSRRYIRLFFSDYAREEGALPLVALSEGRIIGIQTYTPWPYRRNGKVYRSLQSGGTLVHPDYRGQGVFQTMLTEGTRQLERSGADFVVGFPVQASYRGFVRDGWTDLGQLRWWTRPLRIQQLIQRQHHSDRGGFAVRLGDPDLSNQTERLSAKEHGFVLNSDGRFLKWRYDESSASQYGWFAATKQGAGLMVKGTTMHGYPEVLIGRVTMRVSGTWGLVRTLNSLCCEARLSGAAAVSTAVLRPSRAVTQAMILSGFIPGKRTAPLIVRPLRELSCTDQADWHDISLEDVDTW